VSYFVEYKSAKDDGFGICKAEYGEPLIVVARGDFFEESVLGRLAFRAGAFGVIVVGVSTWTSSASGMRFRRLTKDDVVTIRGG
jgi:hypothetical protein